MVHFQKTNAGRTQIEIRGGIQHERLVLVLCIRLQASIVNGVGNETAHITVHPVSGLKEDARVPAEWSPSLRAQIPVRRDQICRGALLESVAPAAFDHQ